MEILYDNNLIEEARNIFESIDYHDLISDPDADNKYRELAQKLIRGR